MRSLSAVPHLKSDLPLWSNRFEFNEFGLSRSNSERDRRITFFIALNMETNELEVKLLLEGDPILVIHIVVGNTSLVLIHVLVNLQWLLRGGMNTLSLLTLGDAEILQLLWTVHYSLHSLPRRHRETSWIVLSNHNGLRLSWTNINLITVSLEWLQ